MHYEEIWIINVKLYRLEQILNRLLLRAVAIDEVFTGATEDDLAGYGYLSVFLEANWGFGFVAVVEDDSDAGFGNACLATLVDEVLTCPYN